MLVASARETVSTSHGTSHVGSDAQRFAKFATWSKLLAAWGKANPNECGFSLDDPANKRIVQDKAAPMLAFPVVIPSIEKLLP